MAVKQQLNNKKNNKLSRYIRLYIIPIISGSIFIGILIGLVIPNINEIFFKLDQISNDNNSLEQKNSEISLLKSLADRTNMISSELNLVNQIAPSGTTEVVKFKDKMANIIQQDNLSLTSVKISENKLDPTVLSDKTLVGNILLQEVPVIFQINGTYNNLSQFINGLSSISDFIIVKEMQLSSKGSSTNKSNNIIWQLSINIVKYQFRDNTQVNLNKIYADVSTSAKISQTMQDYLNKRQQ